jgi:hypothetical protein
LILREDDTQRAVTEFFSEHSKYSMKMDALPVCGSDEMGLGMKQRFHVEDGTPKYSSLGSSLRIQ